MTAEAVLIAALSGRALASAARRAGFLPLVVDAFGDADTHEIAAASRCLGDAVHAGFRAKPLIATLTSLSAEAPTTPVGLVLGSGFEDTPRLISTLSKRSRLLGSGANAIKRAKDPHEFFALLDRLGIAHPETRLSPPDNPAAWLSKRIGGSGGAHVIPCTQVRSTRGRYFQRRLTGAPVSLLALAHEDGVAIAGFSRQWTIGSGPRPFRYGGAAAPISLDRAVETRMVEAATSLCRELNLIGLVSFDFILAEATPYLLEVNPRPGATLDVLDPPGRALLRAHIEAARGSSVTLMPAGEPRAAAILYADAGPLRVGDVAWPVWSADRPAAGTTIPRHRPIATVFASGSTADEARNICSRRLDELTEMLYGRAQHREPNHANANRPISERLGVRRPYR